MAYSPVPEPPKSPPAEERTAAESSGSEIQPQHSQSLSQSQSQSQSLQQMTSSVSDAAATENEEAPPAPAPVPGPTPTVANETSNTATEVAEKWPGWPGYNVFRLVVPVVKVGSIIGRKGELIKKLCDETRARVRILEGPIGTTDRIVLISGKEEPDAELSSAMIAVLRIFKSVSGLSPTEGDDTGSVAGVVAFCSIRLLVPSSQAIHLIGKQGTTIKSIQEGASASIRVSSSDEVPSYATPDERIIEIHGDGLKVLKALEAILGLLRKFLVDHSVVPIFEKTYNATIAQDRSVKSWDDKTQSLVHPASAPAPQAGIGSEFSLSLKRNPFLFERESQLDPEIPHSGRSFYGQDTSHGVLHSTGFGRAAAPIVTQMTKTMQVPLSYAEDIIGIGGANIAYIRRSSGAILTIQESRGLPDEITVEIKGTSSQVQTAEQLIQEFINTRKEPVPSIYGRFDNGLTSYSHMTNSYSPSSFPSQPLGGYGSSSVGGYSSFRF